MTNIFGMLLMIIGIDATDVSIMLSSIRMEGIGIGTGEVGGVGVALRLLPPVGMLGGVKWYRSGQNDTNEE
jgi:hypothetical protein